MPAGIKLENGDRGERFTAMPAGIKLENGDRGWGQPGVRSTIRGNKIRKRDAEAGIKSGILYRPDPPTGALLICGVFNAEFAFQVVLLALDYSLLNDDYKYRGED